MLALKGALRLITSAGPDIENGTVLIEDGKIVSVGKDLRIPDGAEIIDVSGKWVVPGFMDAHSHVSVIHEPVPMGTILDGNESVDPVLPFIRAVDAFDPFDPAFSELRKAGFTAGCTLPGSANIIGGTTICYKTNPGKTLFDMIIPGTEQMKMALGENPKNYGKKGKMPMTRMGTGALLREALTKAKVYAEKREAGKGEFDFRLEPLVPVIKGEMVCRIHCHRADDIVTAVRIAEEFGLSFVVEHVTEGYKIADYLAEHKVRCVVGPINLSPRKEEIWYTSLENPGILDEAGCLVCLSHDSASGTKWLPMHAGVAVAHGMKYESAIRALTINPAKVMGLDSRIGSLEPGKDADIAVWTGDPLSNYSLCAMTVIDGKVYRNL